jgi:hypothetical protein
LPKPTISIITATLNVAEKIERLIESLRKQSYKDFQWVIVDGESTDSTLAILSKIKDLNLLISSKSDFGIYDALNRGIKLSSGQYYVVIGADDYFYENAIEIMIRELSSSSYLDVLVGQVRRGNGIIKIKYGQKYLYGAGAFVASHSVGCVFNKSLHDKYGFYSNKYPILADTFFIKNIFGTNSLRYKYTNDVFGVFSDTGISHKNLLGVNCEFLQIQLITEKLKFLQLMIFILRITKLLIKNINLPKSLKFLICNAKFF